MQRRVTHDQALAAIRASLEAAEGPVSIAVVDDHGELVACVAIDGAARDTLENARRKAYTAARSDATTTRALAEKVGGTPTELASFDPQFSFFLGGVAAFDDGRRSARSGSAGCRDPRTSGSRSRRSPPRAWSQPDPEGPSHDPARGVDELGPHAHPPAQRSAVDRLNEPARARTELPRGGEDPRRAAAARDEEPDAATPQRLGHVAGVRDPQLEEPCAARPAHPQAAESQAPCDPARRADDHDDAEPHPDREPAARADGRVVSSTSASWSPGSTRAGTRAETATVALAPAASTNRVGRTVSHAVAARRLAPGATRGRPRRSRPNPARVASTATASLPGFVTRIAAPAEPGEGDARRGRGQADGRARRARARRGGHEHDGDQREERGPDHRPIAVNVTVAV